MNSPATSGSWRTCSSGPLPSARQTGSNRSICSSGPAGEAPAPGLIDSANTGGDQAEHAEAEPGLNASDEAEAEPVRDGAPETLALAPGQSLEDYLEAVEKKLITEALESTRWNKTAAAKKLGITFRALRYRLQKLDLE